MFYTSRLGLVSICALIVRLSMPGLAQEPKEVAGSWTAELHPGKVFVQVRTTAPNSWTSWNGDWNMGQSFAVRSCRAFRQRRTLRYCRSGTVSSSRSTTSARVKARHGRTATSLTIQRAFSRRERRVHPRDEGARLSPGHGRGAVRARHGVSADP